jgi:hypothetical protein
MDKIAKKEFPIIPKTTKPGQGQVLWFYSSLRSLNKRVE